MAKHIIPLIEAIPTDYAYLQPPRLSGHGGDGAVIYRNSLTCSPGSFGAFSTFEFLDFVLKVKLPVLCVIVYRPPNQNKAFLSEFSELLTVVMSRHNRLHTLDLVLFFGLSLSNFVLCNICVSDHKVILFDNELPLSIPKLPAPACSGIINSTTPSLFSSAYSANSTVPVIESSSTSLNTDELIGFFHKSCLSILDSIAPLKIRARKSKIPLQYHHQEQSQL